MGAYGEFNKAMQGMLYGLLQDQRPETWACKETAGIEFGEPVFGYIGDEISGYKYHNDVSKIVYSTDFITGNSTIVTVNSVDTTPVVFTSDHDTTVALLVAAVAALTGVECILDPADGSNLTILIRTKGVEAVATSATTLGASQPTTVITVHSGQVYVGTAHFLQNANGLYALNEAVNVLAHGQLWVVAKETIEANEDCFVIVTPGATLGQWGNAGVQINAKYRSSGVAAGFVRQFVNGQTEMTYAASF